MNTAITNETAPTAQAPYGGFVAGTNELVDMPPHLLVTGPAGAGKTTRILAPQLMEWRGPRAFVTSEQFSNNLLDWLGEKGISQRGPLYIMDLGGDELQGSSEWHRTVDYTRVTSDPTTLIQNSDHALEISERLLYVGTLGASDSREDYQLFEVQMMAARPLAALLEAAQASGLGMAWVIRKLEAIAAWDASQWEVIEHMAPELHRRRAWESLAQENPKIREAMIDAMRIATTPWWYPDVQGKPGDKAFHPSMLEGPGEPTLAIIAPADGRVAGAAVTAIEALIAHWCRGADDSLPQLLLSLDQVISAAPLLQLPDYIAEAHEYGVCISAAVQTTKQMVLRWGHDGAERLRRAFPAALMFEGSPEGELLEQTAEPDSLLPTIPGQARLLLHGAKEQLVELPGIWEF